MERDVHAAPGAESGELAEADGGEGAALVELVLDAYEAEGATGVAVGVPGVSAQEGPVAPIDGVVVGTVAAVEASGQLRVTYPGGPDGGTEARSMATIAPQDVGSAVAILFEGGDPRRPVVMGKMHSPAPDAAPVVHADGGRVELQAERELVLSCGKASITLTRAGKILIRGAYVLSRSSGVQRIQGGSVQIN